jgi:hypothetical protein
MKKPLHSGFFLACHFCALARRKALLAWTLGPVEPVGQHEQAEDHEHDDEDVFDFHGFSFGDG